MALQITTSAFQQNLERIDMIKERRCAIINGLIKCNIKLLNLPKKRGGINLFCKAGNVPKFDFLHTTDHKPSTMDQISKIGEF